MLRFPIDVGRLRPELLKLDAGRRIERAALFPLTAGLREGFRDRPLTDA